MKRSKSISLLLASAVVLPGCGMDMDAVEPPTPDVRRDAYSKLEDCVRDWGDTQLCTEAAKLAANQRAAAPSSQNGGVVFVQSYPIYGPEYVPGSSYTYRDGQQYVRKANTAVAQSQPVKPSANFVNTRNAATKMVAKSSGSSVRGGFGSSGRSFGSSGG